MAGRNRVAAALRLIVLGALGLAAIAGCVVAGLIWQTLPGEAGEAALPGLRAPVTVRFDADHVPFIQAQNDIDAAEALGYLHARDRMAQMDLMRRAAAGELAELVGPAAVAFDERARVLELRRRVEEDYPLLPAHTRLLLEAYARGVNAWIDARGRFASLQALLLGAPRPWRPEDSLLWGKTMSLYLSGNYHDELNRLVLAGTLTPGQLAGLWPSWPQPKSPDAAMLAAPGAVKLANALSPGWPRFPAPFTLPAEESNEWAVAGSRSATGAPLLAGDPHLGLSLPGIWYLARIDTPDQTLAGATAPGVPFLVLGHNRRIAWTFTNSGTDTQDVYVERVLDAGHYQGPDGALPFVVHDETIHVRGASDILLKVRETRHGPVISDQEGGAAKGTVLAVAMAALAPGDTAAGGLDALDHAGDLTAALAAAPLITSPNQNLLAADTSQIGMAMTGRVPLRRENAGAIVPDAPLDGASSANDWTGWASGAQLPRDVAPATGMLVNGNERTAPADFPVYLGSDWFGDWRARRIRQMLDARPKATVTQFVHMQKDVTSAYAAELLPFLLKQKPRTRLGRQALAAMANWDGRMEMDAPQPLIFNAWFQQFALDLLARAHVPPAEAGPRMEFVAAVLEGRQAGWCGGDCGAASAAAMDEAAAALRARYGAALADWRWGLAHQAVFADPFLSRLPLVGRFAVRKIAAAGDEGTVGRGGMAEGAALDFTDVHAASYRGDYDLADLDRSRFIVAPGQSGNPFSRHAGDFMRRWRDGETVLLPPQPEVAGGTLHLNPAEAAP